MPRVRSKNAHQHVSDFDKGRKVERVPGLCGLSYRSIVARVCRDSMTVSRIWNRGVQDGNTERHSGSQMPSITNSREDRHITRMALMDSAATPQCLRQEFSRQVSARIIRRRLQQLGLSARRPWLRLHLKLHHR
ncbi:HTH_Tnp_Tc3_2 domain-containing protein [Trichonephila clavipes]|nr:HTH_Tnp_Tc3_2 domain-containing protein [Trichonephila clavipes]